jgi:hypothetical protein
MNLPSDEDLWYLLDRFNGIEFVFALFFLMIWIRFLLMVLEDALRFSRSSVHQSGHTLEGTDGFPAAVLQRGIDESKPASSSPRLTTCGEGPGHTDSFRATQL